VLTRDKNMCAQNNSNKKLLLELIKKRKVKVFILFCVWFFVLSIFPLFFTSYQCVREYARNDLFKSTREQPRVCINSEGIAEENAGSLSIQTGYKIVRINFIFIRVGCDSKARGSNYCNFYFCKLFNVKTFFSLF
jgi:hypothetical protein